MKKHLFFIITLLSSCASFPMALPPPAPDDPTATITITVSKEEDLPEMLRKKFSIESYEHKLLAHLSGKEIESAKILSPYLELYKQKKKEPCSPLDNLNQLLSLYPNNLNFTVTYRPDNSKNISDMSLCR